MTTLDEAMDYLLSVDNPVDACATAYVRTYENCVELLVRALDRRMAGGRDLPEDFVGMRERLAALEALTMFQFVEPGKVAGVLAKVWDAIDRANDGTNALLALDGIRGRQVDRYVPDDMDTEGMEPESIGELPLAFLSHGRVIPKAYTPEFAEYVSVLEKRIREELEATLEPDAGMTRRMAILRDLVVRYCSDNPYYAIHRRLSDSMLPCVHGDGVNPCGPEKWTPIEPAPEETPEG